MGVAMKVFAYYKPEQININELYEQIKESFITAFKGEIEIVKKLHSLDTPIEKIAEIVELSTEEVKKIIK